MISFLESLKIVCARLDGARIPYMISGSTAANLYAQPRATNDVDIVIQVDQGRSEELLNLFQRDFYISKEAVDDAFGGIGMVNIIHQTSVIKFDLIILKTDDFSRSAFARRTKETFEGREFWFISLEDLVLQKFLWHKEGGSELQREDVRRLVLANRTRLDVSYCSEWAGRLQIGELMKELL
ncbi:MAG: hypothetical protein HYZ01_07600 [Ignavibacteriales bacterium]|nr:hypothetical protein [Ignavibacteriales bacterium]